MLAVDRLANVTSGERRPRIVLATLIGAKVGAALARHGIGYLDLAGNCHLELDGGEVTIHIEGRRQPEHTRASAGALREAGYRVLFALLADESLLAQTVREQGDVAGTSRHAAHTLLTRLRDEGLLIRTGRSAHVFAPHGRAACIDRFTNGWADVLRSRLDLGRFRLRQSDPDAAAQHVATVMRATGIPFGFGATRGSARWLHHLESNETTIHVTDWPPDLARRLDAAPDRDGTLQVFRTMSIHDLSAEFEETAHPLLIHAELARSSDPRARETAILMAGHLRTEPG